MVTEQAILLYIKGQCSAEDAAAVKAYLDDHPDVLEKYLGEAEWDAFDAGQALDAKLSRRYWQRIYQATAPASQVFLLPWRRIAVAAAVLLLVGLSWIFLFDNRSNSNAEQEITAYIKTVSNDTKKAMLLRLSDNSQVELMPNSELSYPVNFTATKREVLLKGSAIFSVAKEADRIFSVQTDSLLTEVLGTRFTIHAFADESQIRVLLHEGRVRMRSIGMPFAGNKSEYILQPGDTFVFDKRSRQVNVSGISNSVSNADPVKAVSREKNNKGREGDNWYMFNNQSLADVLQQLQIIYNTPIHYRKEDIKGMTFIGKIDKADSLESILTTIVMLNQLELVKEEKGYTIKK